MQCPYCSGRTKVTNSRSHNNNHAVWRRRECLSCHALWTSSESYELTTTHRVYKPSTNTVEPFQRDVLFVSILDALKHRKHSTRESGALTDTIISKVLTQSTPIITIEAIINLTVETLQAFDPTAAAVYAAQQRT